MKDGFTALSHVYGEQMDSAKEFSIKCTLVDEQGKSGISVHLQFQSRNPHSFSSEIHATS